MATTYLQRTPSSEGNRKTFTFSGWFKRSDIAGRNFIFSGGQDNQYQNAFGVEFGDKLYVYDYDVTHLVTNASFKDTSAWYHVVVAVDTTQATASNRIKLYVNGEQITSFSTSNYPGQNENTGINMAHPQQVGSSGGGTHSYDGYMAHVHLTDGYAYAASSFGSTSTNGQWVPNIAPSVTYGTNGFFLKFTNASDLGEDFSGNNNDFTKNGSGDKTSDSPENVFATLNPLDNGLANSTFSEGNCKMVTAASGYGYPRSTIGLSTGKWYFEAKASDLSGNLFVGIVSTAQTGAEQEVGYHANDYGYKFASSGAGSIRTAGSENAYGNAISTSDILGVAIDLDNNKLYFSKNGTFQNSADPVSGSNGFSITAPSSTVAGAYFPTASDINSNNSSTLQLNFGNPSFTIASGNADGNGKGNFEYAPPTGYLAICSDNLSSELTLPIGKGDTYFKNLKWDGDNTTRNITGVGFAPDFVWIRSRNAGAGHALFDKVRGASKQIGSDGSGAEQTTNEYGFVTAFGSDGYTLTPGNQGAYASGNVNMSGRNFIGWNWRAGGSGSSNTDGSVTSTVSANTTAGFSIVTWTGTGANATVGHGLGAAGRYVVITKNRTDSVNWAVQHPSLAITESLRLDVQGAVLTGRTGDWNSTAPTSTVFYVGTEGATNGSSDNMVAYVFREIEGYSKFGTYTGNGNNGDGAFVYTGFRPSWVMTKNTVEGSTSWVMVDSARSPINPAYANIMADSQDAENSSDYMQGLHSNGFKWNSASSWINKAGQKYVYMAFAENPFVDSSGVPANAR